MTTDLQSDIAARTGYDVSEPLTANGKQDSHYPKRYLPATTNTDALMRVTRLLTDQTRELVDHAEALALEVGSLRERSTHLEEQVSQLIAERNALQEDVTWLQDMLRQLEDELEAHSAERAARRTQKIVLVTTCAVVLLLGSITMLISWMMQLS